MLMGKKKEKERKGSRHYTWTKERSRGRVPGPGNLFFFSMGCTDCMDDIPLLPKYLGGFKRNALLSHRNDPGAVSQYMIFDVSVRFLELSQMPAVFFSSRNYLQEQHICLNHPGWKHLGSFCALVPPFPVFLLLQPQALCNVFGAALMFPSRLTLCRRHERAPQ